MFAIDCPSHGRQVLVTDRRIRSLANTDHGIVIDVECWCGTHVTLLTGRAAGDPAARLARTLTPAA
jgi:acetyltransferase-like isoleucine patch superfamily enzyme